MIEGFMKGLKQYDIINEQPLITSTSLRESDFTSINSQIKLWLFADQLEYPEEIVLHRPRNKGGLNLIHTKFKSASLMIRSFLKTAVIGSFENNLLFISLAVDARHDSSSKFASRDTLQTIIELIASFATFLQFSYLLIIVFFIDSRT